MKSLKTKVIAENKKRATDEQQCQGWRENSNKKALRLVKGDGLFVAPKQNPRPTTRTRKGHKPNR